MRCPAPILLLLIGCLTVVADDPKTVRGKVQAEAKRAKQAKVDPQSKPVSFWMEKKLEYTQEILRGLASGDLDDVADKAEQMRLLSKVEGWIRNRKPGYRAQFQAFEFANAEILRNAKAGNLDGATIAFQQLTISCVSCHKLLRDVD
jgi:hypothetical protein